MDGPAASMDFAESAWNMLVIATVRNWPTSIFYRSALYRDETSSSEVTQSSSQLSISIYVGCRVSYLSQISTEPNSKGR